MAAVVPWVKATVSEFSEPKKAAMIDLDFSNFCEDLLDKSYTPR